MRLMMKYAAMPMAELVKGTRALATSAADIEIVSNFLKSLADAIEERALDQAG